MRKLWVIVATAIGLAVAIGMAGIAITTALDVQSVKVLAAADILNLAFVGVGIIVAVGIALSRMDSRKENLDSSGEGPGKSIDLSGMVIVNSANGQTSIARDGHSLEINVRSASPTHLKPACAVDLVGIDLERQDAHRKQLENSR